MPHIIPTHNRPDISANLAQLIEFGFVFVGSWEISGAGINFRLVDHHYAKQRYVLYGFAVDYDLVYIGKSKGALSARMQAYKCPAKGSAKAKSTNEANNRRIREQLDRGRRIDILALCPDGPWEYRGVRINLAAGMEDALIDELAPGWNGAGNERLKRGGVMGGRQGQGQLKLWFNSPLIDRLQELATRNGTTIEIEASVAITKHVQENGLWPPPKKGEMPQEFKEPT